MKPAMPNGVGHRATSTRATKAAPALGQQGLSDQRSRGARAKTVDGPDAAGDEADEVDRRAAM